ncbi:hypothetical protein Tco_0347558 [Tanacetum coccineum]
MQFTTSTGSYLKRSNITKVTNTSVSPSRRYDVSAPDFTKEDHKYRHAYAVNMDNPNITMEEYIRLEEERARKRGKVFNWKTATYGKIWDNKDVHDLGSIQTEFPAISFNDKVSSKTLSWDPTDLENEKSTNIGGEFQNLEDLEVLES